MHFRIKQLVRTKQFLRKEAQLADEKSKVEAKNKIISEKEAVVQDQKQTISELEAKIQAQEQTISGQNDQLTKKEVEVKAKEEEISKQKIEINKKNEEINNPKEEIEKFKHKKTFVPQAIKNIKEASQEAFEYVAEAYSSGRVHSTIKQRRSDVANDLKNVVGSAKNAYGTSVEYVKGKFNSAGNKLKNVYGTLVEYTKGALNSVGSSLYSRIYGTKVSSPEEQFKREDGSKPSMQELTRLDYLNIDNVPKQPDHLNVDAAKSYLMSLSEDQDVFYDAESGDEKGTEISSPESQPTKEENGQGWFAWSLGKVKSAMTEVVVIDADVTKPYFAKVTKALAT